MAAAAAAPISLANWEGSERGGAPPPIVPGASRREGLEASELPGRPSPSPPRGLSERAWCLHTVLPTRDQVSGHAGGAGGRPQAPERGRAGAGSKAALRGQEGRRAWTQLVHGTPGVGRGEAHPTGYAGAGGIAGLNPKGEAYPSHKSQEWSDLLTRTEEFTPGRGRTALRGPCELRPHSPHCL